MQLLDRTRQRELLTLLAKIYPNRGNPTFMAESLSTPLEVTSREFIADAYYLRAHGLIDMASQVVMNGKISIFNMTITAKGMDFLQDDGGLSAILGVVTVRLHEDTIKELVIDKVKRSDGDETAKKKLIDAIKSLPADTTKTVATRLVEAGLMAAPGTLAALHTWLFP